MPDAHCAEIDGLILTELAPRVTVTPLAPPSIAPHHQDPMTTMTLQALIFDLDGVLTDTAELHYRTWQRVAEDEGFAFSRSLGDQLRGVSRRASLEAILAGRVLSEAQMTALQARKNDHFLTMLNHMTPADLLPGVLPLLDDARASGLRTAVASASQNAHAVLDRLGIRPRFDVICDGHSVLHSKPAPDLFLLAATRLNVPPSACVVFEDAAAGIVGARAAGMMVVGVGPPSRVDGANLVVSSLANVRLADLQRLVADRQPPAAEEMYA